MTLAVGLMALVVAPAHALAPPEGKGGGKGGGDSNTAPKFTVTVTDDTATTSDNLWAPGPSCVGETPDAKTTDIVTVVFFHHQTCATLVTSDQTTLTDDLTIRTTTNERGDIVSISVTGQTEIGKTGIMHESEEIAIDPPVTPVKGNFAINVDRTNVRMYNCGAHLARKNTVCDTPAGTFSIDDISYVLQTADSSIESTIRYAPGEEPQ